MACESSVGARVKSQDKAVRMTDTPNDRLLGFDDYEQTFGDMMRGRRASMGKSLLDIQKHLGIRIHIIIAIENCDPFAFESPSFVPGHVRAYARFLGVDPETAYTKFCEECEQALQNHPELLDGKLGQLLNKVDPGGGAPFGRHTGVNPRFSLATTWGSIEFPSVSAIVSTAFMMILVSGIGYLGWTAFSEIQRIHTTANVSGPEIQSVEENLGTSDVVDGSGGALNVQNYGAPETPGLSNIGDISPETNDTRTAVVVPQPGTNTSNDSSSKVNVLGLIKSLGSNGNDDVKIKARRETWIQITTSNNSIIYEGTLGRDKEYTVPNSAEPLKLRTGNSGYMYVYLGEKAYGPIGKGTSITKEFSLASSAIESYFADRMPDGKVVLAAAPTKYG